MVRDIDTGYVEFQICCGQAVLLGIFRNGSAGAGHCQQYEKEYGNRNGSQVDHSTCNQSCTLRSRDLWLKNNEKKISCLYSGPTPSCPQNNNPVLRDDHDPLIGNEFFAGRRPDSGSGLISGPAAMDMSSGAPGSVYQTSTFRISWRSSCQNFRRSWQLVSMECPPATGKSGIPGQPLRQRSRYPRGLWAVCNS